MIETFICYGIGFLAGSCVIAALCWRIPLGYQDETGYHDGEPPK